MTHPSSDEIGRAWIEVDADTAGFPESVDRGVREATAKSDPEFKKAGDHWGKTTSESLGNRMEQEVPNLARQVEARFSHETLHPHVKVEPDYDYDNDTITRTVRSIAKKVEQEFTAQSGGGGIFTNIGNFIGGAFADGIGAGFNVSGKSPLIALLIPVFAELGVLIGGLIQALGPLLGLLTTLPAIIGGIGLSVGTLFLAFHGLGTAIQGAFAATNAKELNAALKDLTPAAQSFVRELLGARDVFKQLSQDAQQGFFSQIAGKLTALVHDLSILFHGDLQNLAINLGQFFGKLLDFFNSPSMKIFLTELFPATEKWIQSFGTGLVDLLTGLVDLATASLPFLSTVGADLNSAFGDLGKFLSKLSKDPAFKQWLDSMLITFDSLLGVFKAAGIFIAEFLVDLDKAGGEKFLQAIADQLNLLTAFFSSDAGIHALKGFIDILIFLGDAFIGIVVIVGFVVAALEEFFEWVTTIGIPAIGDFFGAIGKGIADFREPSNKFFEDIAKTVINALSIAGAAIRDFVFGVGHWFADAGTWLVNAGRDIVMGLWHGIESLGGWLRDKIIQWAKNNIPKPIQIALGISSPSKVMMELGKQTALGFGIGFDDEFQKNAANIQATLGNTNTSNIGFGPGAIHITFAGQLPTNDQATGVGTAVGAGIGDQLAARNASLAVRTM